jgi:DNA polymerase (family 10)
MPVHNADIARVFEEIADLLDIGEANPFRVRAYRNAARTVAELQLDLVALVAEGAALPKLPGIGQDLAAKIREIADTGGCALLERLRRELPPAVTQLLRIPGLGPKRVRTLWHELEVQTLEQLARAGRDGRIRGLPGFGPRTEARIIQSIGEQQSKARRFKLAVAAQYAQGYVAWLRGGHGAQQIEVAGSFRRMRETVGDLDILVAARDAAAVIRRFTGYGEVAQVLSSGSTRAAVMLRCGIGVDLRVVSQQSYGAALHYFTGSKAHNIAIRRLGQARGLKINEYGVYRGTKRVAGETEESVYRAVGLPTIPPELREDRGEIEAARQGSLPRLIELGDLKGDLHVHTKWSDGHHSVKEMAQDGARRGLQYIAVTEHSRRLAVARGLDPARLAQQGREIDSVNRGLSRMTVLKGIEVDILEDGSLDLPESALTGLDIVVGAVHSSFHLSRERQTERVLAALDGPRIDVLAHPTGRLIDAREPYDIDMAAVIRKAAATRTALELNAHPERLDLLDTYCRIAKDEGALVAIDSDAHSEMEFDNLRFGIGQARRGWIEAGDCLNTRSITELKAWLAKGHGAVK